VLAFSRFANLDARPLSDNEALHALGASVGTQGTSEFWDSKETTNVRSPLYHLPTHLLFQVFGAEGSIARIVPAAAGFLLLLLVVFLWKGNAPGSKILWLLLLGFSPVILTASRTANGDILAAVALFVLLVILLEKDISHFSRPELSFALAAGIALAAGSAVYKALTGIAFTALLISVLSRSERAPWVSFDRLKKLLKFAWLIPVSGLLISSGFGGSPEGIQGLAFALEQWLLGWGQPSGHSVLELILLLFTGEPLILIFGVAGAVRYWRNRDLPGRFAALWALGAFFFITIYQGRTPLDLIWLILPLSYLALQAIQELINSLMEMSSNQELMGLIALLLTFAASAALSIVAYGSGNVLTIDPGNPNLILFLFLALAIMGLSVLVFFGVGWSWSIVIQAVGILAIVLSLSLGIASMWRLNFTQDGYHVQELWWQATPARALPLMVNSLENAALAYSGHRYTLPIRVQDDPPPSFAWALRHFQKAEGQTTFGVEAAPVVLTLDANQEVNLPADYIGQSLAVRELRAWETALPPDIFRWWISRTAPTAAEHWVLWLRIDIASFGDIELGG
jgi:hypothetical protein